MAGIKGKTGIYSRTSDMKIGKYKRTEYHRCLGKKLSETNKGKKHSKEWKKKIGEVRKGKSRPEEFKRKMAEIKRGNKSHFWKGGITPINKIIKESIEFSLWREAVFARDNWTCQKCNKRGEKLHPHHIKSFSQYPDLRFAIDNGQTLCKDCHKKTDNYAWKSRI